MEMDTTTTDGTLQSVMDRKIKAEGLTYDDVLLVPARSTVMPRETDTSSWLTQNIRSSPPPWTR
jgi:IMP dehydrogenase